MSAESTQPTRQALAARDRSLPGRVTGRLLVAVNAMVWEAASRRQAAEIARMTDHSLRQALRRPHVMKHYLDECEMLRLSGRAKRLHRLEELAMQDSNKNAAVAAIKAAEGLGDEADARHGGRSMPLAPGLVIQVIGDVSVKSAPAVDVTPRPATIDAEPMIPAPFAPHEPAPEPEPPRAAFRPRFW